MKFCLIAGWCVLTVLSAQSKEVFSGAEWIRDPVFKDAGSCLHRFDFS